MKKAIAAILVLALAVSLIAACGGSLSKPKSGTYKSDDLISQTWKFSGSDKITVSSLGISASGTYEISGDTIEVTLTMSLFGYESEDTSSYTITEITKSSFVIDGTKFIKQ
ncbi:MAG: hypothetical protein LBS90_02965 [Oscillospiraceae bacterium]|jgi:hypothetical protein|nr:hypothetical protein [Oscillospiraceae bacterium]